jgi:hypothetical protein
MNILTVHHALVGERFDVTVFANGAAYFKVLVEDALHGVVVYKREFANEIEATAYALAALDQFNRVSFSATAQLFAIAAKYDATLAAKLVSTIH